MPSSKRGNNRNRGAMQHDRSRGRGGRFRIIAGRWRGRKLEFPPLSGIRPSPDRVRETLFNWLAPVVEGSVCLDLFAGSGALGLEALSRGAAHVSFVDTEPEAARRIQSHIELLGCHDAQASIGDAFEFLADDSQGQRRYDLVFLDPPFDGELEERLISDLDCSGLLATKAYIYLEMPAGRGLPAVPRHWQPKHSKSAGQVGYHLWLKA